LVSTEPTTHLQSPAPASCRAVFSLGTPVGNLPRPTNSGLYDLDSIRTYVIHCFYGLSDPITPYVLNKIGILIETSWPRSSLITTDEKLRPRNGFYSVSIMGAPSISCCIRERVFLQYCRLPAAFPPLAVAYFKWYSISSAVLSHVVKPAKGKEHPSSKCYDR
jgi:hypothetical protein